MENATEISTGIILGSLVLLTMASVIIVLVVYYQSKRMELEKSLQEKLLNSALNAEKKERTRISRDLHDGVTGYLNSARVYLTLVKKNLNDEDRITANEAMDAVDTAVRSIEEITHKLMPPMLLEIGIFKAIINVCLDLSLVSGFKAKFLIEGEDDSIEETISYEIYRIVQELMTNIRKYSQAKNVLIKMGFVNNIIRIEIIDDGIHFDFLKNLKEGSEQHGLKNVLARVQLLNGNYTHSNSLPKGNKFTLTINSSES